MVQIIQLHSYKGSYPFGLQKQTQRTYVQMIKEVESEEHLQSYRRNLTLFQQIDSQLLIKMDSYVKVDNQIQIYYDYERMSIKAFIEQQLVLVGEDDMKEKFLIKIISNINSSIEELILLLMTKKIMAILSIENMAITDNQKIKFFIEPDFDCIDTSTQSDLIQYYSTEKIKLQIQLEEFLQHIFSTINGKIEIIGIDKANFVIRGNKLVFVSDQTNRKSLITGLAAVGAIFKSGDKNALLKELESNPKQKFDIKNILDEKKMHKNQVVLNIPTTISKQPDSLTTNKQPELLVSFLTVGKTPNRRDSYDDTVPSSAESCDFRKQVKNYFDNNDDFKKDASFYPEEFIKEDSIAEFDGYQDELERELEDIKKKHYEEEFQDTVIEINNPNVFPNIQMTAVEQKMRKPSGNMKSNYHSNIFNQPIQSAKPPLQTPNPQSNLLNSNKYPVSTTTSVTQPDANQSNSQEDSTSENKKKKYKVTITTSLQVNVEDGDDVDLKEIEKQIIEDLQKGRLKTIEASKQPLVKKGLADKDIFNKNLNPNQIKGRQTHNPSSSQEIYNNPFPNQYRNTSLNGIGSNVSSSLDEQVIDDKPFSKQHPQISSEYGLYLCSGKELKLDPNAVTNPHPTHDIRKIIEKIKNNSQNQNQQNAASTTNDPLTPTYPQSNTPQSSTIFKPSTQKSTQSATSKLIEFEKKHSIQQQYRPLSHLPSQGVRKEVNQGMGKDTVADIKPPQKLHHDKEYYDKIQRAKLKAEEIMKLVKERKVQ